MAERTSKIQCSELLEALQGPSDSSCTARSELHAWFIAMQNKQYRYGAGDHGAQYFLCNDGKINYTCEFTSIYTINMCIPSIGREIYACAAKDAE